MVILYHREVMNYDTMIVIHGYMKHIHAQSRVNKAMN